MDGKIASAWKAILILAAVMGITALIRWSPHPYRPTHKVFIPEGFSGWVSVCFNAPGEPRLPVVDGHLIFQVDATGTVKTQALLEPHFSARDEFYVNDGSQWKRLETEGHDDDVMVSYFLHAASWLIEEGRVGELVKARSYFFVGRREDVELNALGGISAPLSARQKCRQRDPTPVE